MNETNKSKLQVELFPKGAIPVGSELTIRLKIANEYGFVEDVKVNIFQKGGINKQEEKLIYVSNDGTYSIFEGKYTTKNIGINYYYLSLKLNKCHDMEIHPSGEKHQPKLMECGINEVDRFTVYEADFSVPEWAQGAIIYHIFVDRFRRDESVPVWPMADRTVHERWDELPDWKPNAQNEITNTDFFAGNLRGISNSLKYLKRLSVDIIYLSPIVESQSNHRYDAGDYEKIDPYVGCEEDLKELCQKAHSMGMKVILDISFDHTGNDSKYFNEYHKYPNKGAVDGPESEYYNWYKRKDGSVMYWWGFKNEPVCNDENEEYGKYIYGEGGRIDGMFALGIDGIRLDVADEHCERFLQNVRTAIKRNNKEGFFLLEVWEDAITKEKNGIQRTYLLGKAGDSVMNYPFADAILKYIRFGDFKYFESTINEIIHDYPEQAYQSMMNSLSTHDIPRAITTLAGEGIEHNKYQWTWDIGDKSRQWQYDHDILSAKTYSLGKQLLKLAVIIQYFLPGNACIYYGDEVGSCGYKDPFNRKPYPWKQRDKELLKFFREIGKVRKSHSFLKKAKLRIINVNPKFLVMSRYSTDEELIIIVNRTLTPIQIPHKYANHKVVYSLNCIKRYVLGYGAIILAQESERKK